jgi:heme exporter protein B
LTLNRIIHYEFENGSTEFFLLSDFPLEVILFLKTVVHWLTVSIPLLLLMPIIMIALQIELENFLKLLLILLVGSPALSFIGTMTSCLTLSNNSSFLITTITIPFYFPTLLLGIYCSTSTDLGSIPFIYSLLGLNTLFTIILSPFISAYAVKLHYS